MRVHILAVAVAFALAVSQPADSSPRDTHSHKDKERDKGKGHQRGQRQCGCCGAQITIGEPHWHFFCPAQDGNGKPGRGHGGGKRS